MSTIKRYGKVAWRVLVAVGFVVPMTFGLVSPSNAASSKSPVVWHLALNPAHSYRAPAVRAQVNVPLTELGVAPHNSDMFEPRIQGLIEPGTTLRYPLEHMRCGSTDLVNPYAIDAHGKLIVGPTYSLQRLCLDRVARSVNDTCGPDQVKVLVLDVRISRGNHLNRGNSKFRLALVGGGFLYATPAYVKRTLVEYTFFPGPEDRVDLAHKSLSSGFVRPNYGAGATGRLHKICIGAQP